MELKKKCKRETDSLKYVKDTQADFCGVDVV